MGDSVWLSLARQVTHGDLRLDHGAKLHGRITRLEVVKRDRGRPSNLTTLALRLYSIETNDVQFALRAKVTGIELRRAGDWSVSKSHNGDAVLLFTSKTPWLPKYSHFYWTTTATSSLP